MHTVTGTFMLEIQRPKPTTSLAPSTASSKKRTSHLTNKSDSYRLLDMVLHNHSPSSSQETTWRCLMITVSSRVHHGNANNPSSWPLKTHQVLGSYRSEKQGVLSQSVPSFVPRALESVPQLQGAIAQTGVELTVVCAPLFSLHLFLSS